MGRAERGVISLLDDVATARVGDGDADPFSTTPGMQLRCLYAADRLETTWGARADRTIAIMVHMDDRVGLIVVGLLVTMMMFDNWSRDDDRLLVGARESLRAALAELADRWRR